MALLKNHRGEYNYHFYWVDENGRVTGFNDVWAFNKREAVKLAKKMEKQARWLVYDRESREYVEVPAGTEGAHYFEAMLVKVDSMYKATAKQADVMNRLGWMMTI